MARIRWISLALFPPLLFFITGAFSDAGLESVGLNLALANVAIFYALLVPGQIGFWRTQSAKRRLVIVPALWIASAFLVFFIVPLVSGASFFNRETPFFTEWHDGYYSVFYAVIGAAVLFLVFNALHFLIAFLTSRLTSANSNCV